MDSRATEVRPADLVAWAVGPPSQHFQGAAAPFEGTLEDMERQAIFENTDQVQRRPR